MMEKYVTISQAAKKLGVSTETLKRWDQTGKLPSQTHPVSNDRVYPPEQIDRLIQQTEQKSPSDSNPKKEYLREPYFISALGSLYQMDAVDFLQSIDTASVQLVFADPPYNIKKAEWDTFESQKTYVEWSMAWIKEAHRILTPQGSLYICGFSEILADIKWAAGSLFKGCKWLVWYYRNKANLANDWGRSHESLLHFRKSRKIIFNVDAVRIPYNAHTLKYPKHPQAETSQYGNGKNYVWSPHPLGAKPKDVFEIPTLSNRSWEREDHPTQKPVELVKKCILASSAPDGLVVDPFGGSGTTYAVSEAFGRKWMGAERKAEYCKIISKRLENKKRIQQIADGTDESEAVERRKKLRG